MTRSRHSMLCRGIGTVSRLALVAGLSLNFLQIGSAQPGEAEVKVGILKTFFEEEEQDEKKLLNQMRPFADTLEQQMGMTGEFLLVHHIEELAHQMKKDRIHLAAVHGLEYGWLRQLVPDCKPLVIAVNERAAMKLLIVTRKDNALAQAPLEDLKTLRGKRLAWPPRTSFYVRFYLEQTMGCPASKAFRLVTVKNVAAAMDDVVDGRADLAAVSDLAAEVYRGLKPVRYEKLKVIHESPLFPAPALVYRASPGREEMLHKLKDNLLRADATAEGRQMLTAWRLTGFREPPKDYDQQALEIARRYPRPTGK
ncbi:MAG: hypothetical protein C4297_08915 [Gemmataceae bacterium]